jgi:hypothetical protein
VSLEAVERTLARLYTDDRFRERFYAGPEAAAALGLGEDELRELLVVDRAQVERFAESLKRKRLGEVRGLLPSLRDAMDGRAFADMFFEFARAFVPEGVHKHHADAIRFAGWVAERADREVGNAARFERARLGLFFRLEGCEARRRRGVAIALARRGGRRVLLYRLGDSSRFGVVGLSPDRYRDRL